jgi:hypothetical protein
MLREMKLRKLYFKNVEVIQYGSVVLEEKNNKGKNVIISPLQDSILFLHWFAIIISLLQD